MDVKKLLHFWDTVITGSSESDNKEISKEKDSLKNLLYEKTIKVMPEVIVHTGFDKIGLKQSKNGVLTDVFKVSSELDSEPWSFFPQRIIKTRKATCTGNTLIVNYLFNKAGVDFDYGRPEGHSMNFVYLDSETWWVDGSNTVLDKVRYKDEMVDGIKVRRMESSNPKIPYRLIRVLEPRDIIINLFGNMTAMKHAAKEKRDKYSVEIMDEFGSEIEKIDFEKWLFYLYPTYMKYTTQNKDFSKEVNRIKKWQKLE